MKSNNPPPDPVSDLPILQKTADTYIVWHKNAGNLSRFSRTTIGIKIDFLFTEFLELLLRTAYASLRQKLPFLENASVKLDALKYFLRLMREADELPDNKYIEISVMLYEIGKMLGGWRRHLIGGADASRS